MPSGKAHAIATVVTAGAVSPLLALAAQQPIQHTLAFAAGCMLGLIVTPDLDVRHRDTHSETVVRRSGGCLVGGIWNLLWLPYAYIVPYHRHWLSHLPILGTVLRLVYLLAIPALIWWAVGLLLPLPALPGVVIAMPATWWAIGGLALVDALHWGMDKIF